MDGVLVSVAAWTLAAAEYGGSREGGSGGGNPLPKLDIGPVDHRWCGTEAKSLAVFGG